MVSCGDVEEEEEDVTSGDTERTGREHRFEQKPSEQGYKKKPRLSRPPLPLLITDASGGMRSSTMGATGILITSIQDVWHAAQVVGQPPLRCHPD